MSPAIPSAAAGPTVNREDRRRTRHSRYSGLSQDRGRRILKDLHYRLRVNHKRVSAGSGPDRDQQFTYIASQRDKFASRGLPIVVDAKKRELAGTSRTPARGWAKTPQAVNDHDFRSQAIGIAIPYGIYDVTANRGFVVVGTSHDTPDFAADNLLQMVAARRLPALPQCP